MGDLATACRFCRHDVDEHDGIHGCPFCRCLATRGEARARTDAEDLTVIAPDRVLLGYEPKVARPDRAAWSAYAELRSSLAMGIQVESDNPDLAPIVSALTEEQQDWIAAWLAGESFVRAPKGSS